MIEIDFDRDDPAFRACADEWRPYAKIPSLPESEAKAALIESGLSHGRDKDISFVRSVMESVPFAKGLDLRKSGIPTNDRQKADLGLRSNVIVSHNFLDILTPKGLIDPIGSSQFIASAYAGRLASINAIGRIRHAGIKKVRVIPNNMAAGPCEHCLTAAKAEFLIEDAPIGSLPGCPHPTQCAIRLVSVN